MSDDAKRRYYEARNARRRARTALRDRERTFTTTNGRRVWSYVPDLSQRLSGAELAFLYRCRWTTTYHHTPDELLRARRHAEALGLKWYGGGRRLTVLELL